MNRGLAGRTRNLATRLAKALATDNNPGERLGPHAGEEVMKIWHARLFPD